DDAERMTMAAAHDAHAVAHVDAMKAARTANGALAHGEHDHIALLERNDVWPRLHPRALLGHHELPTLEVRSARGQQDRGLERKHMLAVEILVQAVVVATAVLQQQGCRPALTGIVASLEELRMAPRKARVDAHRLVPAVRDRHEVRIKRRAQGCDRL